jgi:hypothetical protein
MRAIHVKECILHGKYNNNLTFIAQKTAGETPLVKSIITPHQHGFFSGTSTVTNLIEFTSFVPNAMENSLRIDSIYTNFSKAFDEVNHRLKTGNSTTDRT